MLKEFFLLPASVDKYEPDFNCFVDAMHLRAKIHRVYSIKHCKWTDDTFEDGMFLEGTYRNDLAHVSILILKTKQELPYIFQLIVKGGSAPLSEVRRLCKTNSWIAYDVEEEDYLDLVSSEEITITDEDRIEYTHDYWLKINQAQEAELNANGEEAVKGLKKQRKWWHIW